MEGTATSLIHVIKYFSHHKFFEHYTLQYLTREKPLWAVKNAKNWLTQMLEEDVFLISV